MFKCAGFSEQLVEKAVLRHTAAHHQDHNAHNSQAKWRSHRGGCKERTRCYTRVWALDLRTKTAQGTLNIYLLTSSKKNFIVEWFMFEVFRFTITFLSHSIKQSFKIKYKFWTVNYCLYNTYSSQCAARPTDILCHMLTYKDQML